MTGLKTLFEMLQTSDEAAAERESRSISWISAATWEPVDNHARLRKLGLLVQWSLCSHNQHVQKSLNKDRAQRAADVAGNIELKLNEGDLTEAWYMFQG